MKECNIIIASFGHEFVDGLLSSIIENTKDVDYAIQVVDNHKDNDKINNIVKPICEKYNVPLHLDNTLTGYGDVLNKGAEVSEDSKYILYMDSDTKVAKGWLREMIDCYERHYNEGCRLVGPRVKKFDESYLECMPEYHPDMEFLSNNDIELSNKTYLVGVCYLRERATINEFKWDKNFLRAYWEDNDFTDQVKFWGYKIWVAGKSLMYHKVNSSHETIKKEGLNPSAVGASNRSYYMQKWNYITQHKTHPRIRDMTLGDYFGRE